MSELKSCLAKEWWVILTRGVLAILFGIILFFLPGTGVLTFVFIFAFTAILDGILGVKMGISLKNQVDNWWAVLLGGIAGILAGILAMIYPINAALVLLIFIAVWTIMLGAFQIIAGIKLREQIEDEWFIILSGVLSILVGALLLANPISGTLALVWAGALFAIFYGVMLVVASFKFKKLNQEI